jgi:hypothetical protein
VGKECTRDGRKRNAWTLLVVEPERKWSLGIPGRGWVYNTKTKLSVTEWDCKVCSYLSRDTDQLVALVNATVNLRLPYMLGSSSVAVRIAASQEELKTM